MRPARSLAAAAALCAAAAAGCGLGPGADAGEVGLTVTRDFGSTVLDRGTESIRGSDTVLRVLDRGAEVETRYGGGFVQSIDGLAGGESGGRRTDWFFYVNGIESPVGAAEYDLSDGDRVWWDHHDWSSAMRTPAVVGSWPEPFVHGLEGRRHSTLVDCRAAPPTCGTVSDLLRAAGADLRDEGEIRVEVGTWERIREEGDVRLLGEGPGESGVFATFTGARAPVLNLLDERAEPAGSLGRGAGLVAALRPGERPPTWVVTGTDEAGVRAAAELLGDRLEDRFALATDAGEPIGVPVR